MAGHRNTWAVVCADAMSFNDALTVEPFDMKRGISPRYNSGRNNGVCKIRIRFPFIPVSVTPILSKIAIPVRLSARFEERIMHRAAAINEIFLELNRADDKIITVRYCMNKRWLGRAIVSNRRKKSDLLLEKRSKYGNWNGSIRYV